MYWQEVPFRVHTVLRSIAQGRGFFTAAKVPQQKPDAGYGSPWAAAPASYGQAATVVAEADRLLAGDYAVFGQKVDFVEGLPDWNRDPVTKKSIPLSFGLSIDFRHVGVGIDIKHLWELNRHVWWVTLAQAWALTGQKIYLQRLEDLLRSWLRSCPYAQGANWSSPVEHGIRLINWSLVWHLIGGAKCPIFHGEAGQSLLESWQTSIYQHMRFASDNYSFYSSADNHLIGEAAGVFVAAQTWDLWIEGRELCSRAKELLESETLKQFAPDGVNREQALCYHKFTLQFLLASALAGNANGRKFSPEYWRRIELAIVFLAAVTDVGGHTPAYGDSDDGEVWSLGAGQDFNTYHAMVALGGLLFERGDLLAKSRQLDSAGQMELPWLVMHQGIVRSAAEAAGLPDYFPEGGYVLLGRNLHNPNELRVLVDCGALGYNRISGHGHADVLSVQIGKSGEQLFVDAGTFCYNAAPLLRHYFRGTHAHNTLAVDDLDQSIYGASFLWLRDVVCTVSRREVGNGRDSIQAYHDGYTRLKDPVRHHRRVSLDHGDSLEVVDWLECKEEHSATLLWHAVPNSRLTLVRPGEWLLCTARHRVRLIVTGPVEWAEIVEGREESPQGWVSSAFYSKLAAPVLVVKGRLKPSQELRTRFEISEDFPALSAKDSNENMV